MKCIIHVGVHKTGSTAIQGALHGYETNGCVYAKLGDRIRNHSHAFQTLFSTDSAEKFWNRLGHSAIKQRRRFEGLLAAALDCEQETIIFSGENISVFSGGALNRMRSALESKCTEFKVVMFVRDPLSWAMSSMQERLKHGGTCRSDPSLQKRYNSISQVFAKEEICVLKYEDKALFDGDVVRFFCSAVDLKPPPDYTPNFTNVSMTSDAYKVLNIHNRSLGSLRSGVEFDAAHWDFVNLVKTLFQDGPMLKKSDFLSHCLVEDYEFLEKHFGIVYEKPNSPTPTTEDFLKLDDRALEIINTHLQSQGSSFNWSCEQELAIRALYHYSVAKTLSRALAVERDKAIAERDKARRYPWKYVGYAARQRISRK
ncbi:hypothetical protein RUESEDTHA_02695 [Ruegeria sp. THAF57]|uniref:hypothetical protein n=1 Tax=Ruegeria sp. THAF57 TaxID=2744555 RepID=UPI0015DEF93A|nr:hypothetical protein [Ruegeria sp. THAF57]CAD0185795.1 hypothetical protein RUESEDTHA_02695 [Ruegeria sp. THAF57]